MSEPYLYPLRLTYAPQTALWGGSRLHDRYGKAGFARMSETWELSVRDDRRSMIDNGPCAGMTLGAYISRFGGQMVAQGWGEARFPLMIKFIDATLPLSLQVHPDDAYAAAHETDSGKHELWHIIEADPGAKMVIGLRDGVTVADFAAALREGNPQPLLHEVEVKAGETYFIPAGLLHAIGAPNPGDLNSGAGILVAEIQQNSNLTYRVWDYDRLDAGGKRRPLHTDRALDVIRPYSADEIEALRFAQRDERGHSLPGACLCATDAFTVHRLFGEGRFTVGDSFVSLLCIDGSGMLTCDGSDYAITAGRSWYLPAGLDVCYLSGSATVLLTRI